MQPRMHPRPAIFRVAPRPFDVAAAEEAASLRGTRGVAAASAGVAVRAKGDAAFACAVFRTFHQRRSVRLRLALLYPPSANEWPFHVSLGGRQ